VCGEDYSRLDALWFVRADRVDLLLLQDAEEATLELGGGVPDLVQEDGAPSRRDESSGTVARCTRESTLHVPEQLRFEQAVR
jgi:hypothetical protein